ncbi:MAG: VirB4 family type IV secretion system protein [Solirubrobacteraceae bacterium]
MIHRTFRSLDEPPKLLGFTAGQWCWLIADVTVVLGVVFAARIPAKPAITLLAFLVGLPAALAYVSETGGVQPGRLLADAARWAMGPKRLLAASAGSSPGGRGSAARALGVRAIEPDGLLAREDGTLVRYVEATAVNPLVLDPAEADRVAGAFAQVAARLQDGQSLQLYVQATPLDVEEILAVQSHRCEQAAGTAEAEGETQRALALRALGVAHERSIRTAVEASSPPRLRYVVACPWQPRMGGLWHRGRLAGLGLERARSESLRHTAGVCEDLDAAGVEPRILTGLEVLDLLAARLDPGRYGHGALPASFLHPGAVAPLGDDTDSTVGEVLCSAEVDLSDRSRLGVGDQLERCLFVSHPPEQTWLGWLLHLMQAPCPFAVSVHVQATDRFRERAAQRRRHRRIYGVNRGVEASGRPLSPEARVQEQDATELNEELAVSAGAGIYRVGIYAALKAPTGTEEALGELSRAAGRELTAASDARVQHGPFTQEKLWRSTLPLADDRARRSRRYLTANVGDTFPLVGCSCGSPDGIPVGLAVPGRTLELLDPFDPRHPNHLLLVNGISGAGKTMSAILLLARALSQGATGFIIDRAGHFDFLTALIPGAVTVRVGADSSAVNCWDTDDPAEVGPEKIDYLLALHALLLGEHHQGRDSYGLSDLEANLVGLAAGEVYARCSLTGEEPRELLLQEELQRRYERERGEGSIGVAEALRDLVMRLNNYVGAGPYAYLADRPSTIPARAPLVVFDTRSIPEAKAPAALFAICEHVKRTITHTRELHTAGDAPAHGWAGRSFLVIDEAWKLIERPATGRWFNEFVRRSRHYALWLIAISQQLSDFDNEHGRALLANAAMRLFLRQEAAELARMRDTLNLSEEALAAISSLKTVRGAYSTAYLMNGTRGQAVVQIAPGPWEYWIASSDPARDEPLRQRALRDTGGDAWSALKTLVHQQAAASDEPAERVR